MANAPFFKFPSIPIMNERMVSSFSVPQLDTMVHVEHKIDGENFQVILKKNATGNVDVSFASRNKFLGQKNTLNFKFEDAYEKHVKTIVDEHVIPFMNGNPDLDTMHLVGEIYGGKTSRVRYFADQPLKVRMIKFFALYFNGLQVASHDFCKVVGQWQLPVVEHFEPMSLREAIKFNWFDETTAKSLTNGNDTVIEGVVVKPMSWDKGCERPFNTFKIKSSKYAEIDGSELKLENFKKKQSAKSIATFKNYLTRNRVEQCCKSDLAKGMTNKELVFFILNDALVDYNAANGTQATVDDVSCLYRHVGELLLEKFI